MPITLSRFVRDAVSRLSGCYPPEEAKSIVSALCCHMLGVRQYTYITEPDFVIDATGAASLEEAMSRLLDMEPVQYVIGRSSFYGMSLRVCPSVLIPRPETEELCRLAIDSFKGVSGLRILDLCTGSGCIAWAMSANLPRSKVFGCDISMPALEVACSQSVDAPSPVFFRFDLLEGLSSLGACFPLTDKFDLILSNPPYVTGSEKSSMSRNVLDYEPDTALFVPDDDPLVFYRAISCMASRQLKQGGTGIVEINERFGTECLALFEDAGFNDCEIIKDLNGKDRFCRFVL